MSWDAPSALISATTPAILGSGFFTYPGPPLGTAPPLDVSAFDFLVISAIQLSGTGRALVQPFFSDEDTLSIPAGAVPTPMVAGQVLPALYVVRCLGPRMQFQVAGNASTTNVVVQFTVWGSNRRYAHDGPYTPDMEGTVLGFEDSATAVGHNLPPYAGPATVYMQPSAAAQVVTMQFESPAGSGNWHGFAGPTADTLAGWLNNPVHCFIPPLPCRALPNLAGLGWAVVAE